MTPEEIQALVDRLRVERMNTTEWACRMYRKSVSPESVDHREVIKRADAALADALTALTTLSRDLAAARQERDAAPTPPVVQDAAPEWCHAESPKPREDDDPFVCTLKRGHAGNHIAEDVYGQVQDSWPAAAKAGGEAVRLAREIVNSWACVARTKRDLDYIHACHKKIDALRMQCAQCEARP